MAQLSFIFVDDNDDFLSLIACIAQTAFEGARITKLSDVNMLIPLCAEQDFDCVILDYQMPGMDGLVAAQALRAAHPYLPIVLVTGEGDEEVATNALRNGITDYIPKSRLQQQSLQRALRNAIQTMSQSRVIDEQRRELETFAYALAHDFKQPLRQISTFAQLIEDRTNSADLADLKKFSGFMITAAERLARLVDVMSEYTLLGRPVEMERFNLRPIVEGLYQVLSPFLEERSARIVLHKDAFCYGNGVLTTQIFQNLIVNAVKYNRNPSPVVWISCQDEAEFAVIKVRDNGIGIEDEYLEKIFQPLVRLHSEAQYSGTGLGLTMSRKAAAAQGGSISCRSQLGVGSTFVIRIPLAKKPVLVAAA